MDIPALLSVVLGLAMIWGGGAEFVDWLRARRRLVRVTGVFVTRQDVTNAVIRPGTVSRAGVFEFTTQSGEVYQVTSSLSSFPGPKPGRRVTVSYDPADPVGTAERAGVRSFKVVLNPLLMAGGAVLAAYGVTRL